MIPARLSKYSEVMIAVCEEQNFSKYSLKTLICSNSNVWFLKESLFWIKTWMIRSQLKLLLFSSDSTFTADSTDDWMWNFRLFLIYGYHLNLIWNLARYGEFIMFVWYFYLNYFLFCVPLRKESNESYTNMRLSK